MGGGSKGDSKRKIGREGSTINPNKRPELYAFAYNL